MIEVVFPKIHEFIRSHEGEGEPIEIKIHFDVSEDTKCLPIIPIYENQKTRKN
jgi:hypothetical protein